MGQDDAGGKEVRAFVRDLKVGLLGAHIICLSCDNFAFIVD